MNSQQKLKKLKMLEKGKPRSFSQKIDVYKAETFKQVLNKVSCEYNRFNIEYEKASGGFLFFVNSFRFGRIFVADWNSKTEIFNLIRGIG